VKAFVGAGIWGRLLLGGWLHQEDGRPRRRSAQHAAHQGAHRGGHGRRPPVAGHGDELPSGRAGREDADERCGRRDEAGHRTDPWVSRRRVEGARAYEQPGWRPCRQWNSAVGLGASSGARARAEPGCRRLDRQRGQRGGDNIPIVVGAGEAVLNRHQQAVIEGFMGGGFLDKLFATVRTPHYMAQGGRVRPVGMDTPSLRYAGGGVIPHVTVNLGGGAGAVAQRAVDIDRSEAQRIYNSRAAAMDTGGGGGGGSTTGLAPRSSAPSHGPGRTAGQAASHPGSGRRRSSSTCGTTVLLTRTRLRLRARRCMSVALRST
jgi:hypothetical protein